MKYSMAFIRLEQETRTSLRLLATYAIGRYTQAEAQERAQQWISNFINNAPKDCPKNIIAKLWAYWEGCKDVAWNEQHVFLYNVEGKFYATNNDKVGGIPCWDTLPREQWEQLGDCGGIYWKNNLSPFFVS